jgi:hypothetical protein
MQWFQQFRRTLAAGSGLPKSGALTAYILLISGDLCELTFPCVRGIPLLEVPPELPFI